MSGQKCELEGEVSLTSNKLCITSDTLTFQRNVSLTFQRNVNLTFNTPSNISFGDVQCQKQRLADIPKEC